MGDAAVLIFIFCHLLTVAYAVRDAYSRKLSTTLTVALGAVVLLSNALTLPFYWAWRPLKKGEVREGGYAWNVVRNYAVLWLLIFAGFGGMLNLVEYLFFAQNGSIGGLFFQILILFAVGSIPFLLNTFSRLGVVIRKVGYVEEGPTGPLASEDRDRQPEDRDRQ